jgi:hypothetical protein
MKTMTLDEQQRRDLIGLTSGLGSAESNARAEALLGQSPDARAFKEQLDLLGEALRPETQERLSRSTAIDLAKSIRERTARPPARSIRPWLAVAASLLIVAGGSLWLTLGRVHDRPIASAVFVPAEAHLSVGRPELEVRRFRAGDVVRTTDGWAVVVPADGSKLVLGLDSQLRIDSPQSATLDSGQLAWEGQDAFTITSSGMTIRLAQGQAEVVISASQHSCSVFQGSARVEVAGGREMLVAGERLIWSGSGEKTIRLPVGPAPAWARWALNKAADAHR